MSEFLTRFFEAAREYTEEQDARERVLRWRYPWFDVAYNWLIVTMIAAFAVSCIVWGVQISTGRKAETAAAQALAEYQAAQAAEADARAAELAAAQRSEQAQIERESEALAKAFYGIRNFTEKYHYDSTDLETYARCVFNRVDAGNGVNSLEAIISRPDQFLGYYDTSPVIDNLYKLAKEFVAAWHTEKVKPCDLSYQWAELTDKGIYLINEFGADGYARRWHA